MEMPTRQRCRRRHRRWLPTQKNYCKSLAEYSFLCVCACVFVCGCVALRYSYIFVVRRRRSLLIKINFEHFNTVYDAQMNKFLVTFIYMEFRPLRWFHSSTDGPRSIVRCFYDFSFGSHERQEKREEKKNDKLFADNALSAERIGPYVPRSIRLMPCIGSFKTKLSNPCGIVPNFERKHVRIQMNNLKIILLQFHLKVSLAHQDGFGSTTNEQRRQ